MTKPAYYEDIPSRKPKFDYDLVAEAALSLLLQPREGATVLGIHGAWGSGKTTLMSAVQRQVADGLSAQQPVFVDFNAWKYQDRDALWRALILRVLAELRRGGAEEKSLDDLEQALYRAFEVEVKGPWKINWRTVIVETISGFCHDVCSA